MDIIQNSFQTIININGMLNEKLETLIFDNNKSLENWVTLKAKKCGKLLAGTRRGI